MSYRNRKEVNIKNYILPVVAIAFMVTIYVPTELFFTNLSEFWFSYFTMLPVIILAFVSAIVIGLFICYVIGSFDVTHSLLCGCLMCLYIQHNFLNIDIGVMNGADIEWKKYLVRMILDMAVWIAVLLLVIIISRKNKVIYKKIGIAVPGLIFGVQIITCLVLIISNTDRLVNSANDTAFTDKGLYETTKDSNTLVFILDMFDSTYMEHIVETRPDMITKLDGFTFYDNFSGVYSTTSYSLSKLFTGKNYYNESTKSEWSNSLTKGEVYVDQLMDDGVKVSYYTNTFDSIPDRILGDTYNFYSGKIRVNAPLKLLSLLSKMTICRCFPDGFKPIFWLNGTEFDVLKVGDDANLWVEDNSWFRDNIAKHDRFDIVGGKTLKYIHINGTHYPYSLDETGDDYLFGEVTAKQCAEGVMTIVLKYLDKLKVSGTYDNTNIIITADHGYYWDGVLTSPAFVIKPAYATGYMQINHAPVSQDNFAPTIMGLFGEDASDFGESVFDIKEDDIRERYFYQYYLSERDNDDDNFRLIEYKLNGNANVRDDYKLTDVEYTSKGSKIEHSKYCRTCADGDAVKMDRDFPRLVHEKAGNYPQK